MIRSEALDGKRRIRSVNRKQMVICPLDVENLIDQDHLARAIWYYVGELDLTSYYKEIESIEGEAGRSAFDPQLLISLWLFAYTQKIGTARQISRLCEYHPAFQWLTGLQSVNYHTLADFRCQYRAQLDELFAQSLAVLDLEGLIDLSNLFQDGSKIDASAASNSFHRESRLQENFKAAEELMKESERSDAEVIQSKAAKAKAEKQRHSIQRALEEFKKLPKKTHRNKEIRVSQTDPDCRIMKTAHGGRRPAYNAQICVEGKHGFIVSPHVSQSSSDFGELDPTLTNISKITTKSPKNFIVDSGFASKKNIIKLAKKGINLIGPLLPQSSAAGQFINRGVSEAFKRDAFIFNEQENSYICPAGKTLSFVSTRNGKVSLEHRYQASSKDCRHCTFKSQCLGKTRSACRTLIRSEDAPAVAEFRQRMETDAAKDLYKKRSYLNEFPFAWMKDKFGLNKFHLRGLLKVSTEFLWVCFAHNVQKHLQIRKKMQTVPT